MTKRRIDFLRISAVLIIIFAIIYFDLNLFCPHLIPKTLRVGILRKPINVLFIGTDITYDSVSRKPIAELAGRADSLLLAHIDPTGYKINLLSIPRDTYVNIPAYGMLKINAANALGGAALTKQTVSEFTGQKIDYYIEIRPTLIPKLVNLLGGVRLFVEKDMQYTDHAQGLEIDLKQGWQKLSGKEAHEYIRFRYDKEGDWGRIRRQQQFFKALTHSLVKPTNLLRIPFALNSILGEIKTDLPLAQSIRLANSLRMLNMQNLKTFTATGEETYLPGTGSILVPNKEVFRRTIKKNF